jgi:hypothetical protein
MYTWDVCKDSDDEREAETVARADASSRFEGPMTSDTIAKSEQESAAVWTGNEETETKLDRVRSAAEIGACDGFMN